MRYLLIRNFKQPWNNHRGPLTFASQRYSTSAEPPAASETPKPPRRRVFRSLSTLDPAKLTPHDWVDLGGNQSCTVQWGGTTQKVALHYEAVNRRFVAWPSFAKGFLYFHRAPSLTTKVPHLAAGSLRLRLAESPADLALAFSNEGKDLMNGPGRYTPWSIPTLILQQAPYYAPVWRQALSDGFVTPETAAEIDTLLVGFTRKKTGDGGRDGDDPSSELDQLKPRFRSNMRIIEDVTQPWTLDLDLFEATVVVLAEDRIYMVKFRDVTMRAFGRRKARGKQGVALVQFELDNRKRLVLRLLRYVVPPDCHITAQNLDQTEGQFVRQYLRRNAAQWLPPRIWSADPASMLSPASCAALAKMYG
ncbi:hypothetical protein BKA70DRAFT_1314964 [Coprinopsis sp. MPI-PUGE-AT-0042]|nr:hypothetical protein BKA70DRAFT_1314964 [Coprinopsis sp. MPI-PUGE-AT-0042]